MGIDPPRAMSIRRSIRPFPPERCLSTPPAPGDRGVRPPLHRRRRSPHVHVISYRPQMLGLMSVIGAVAELKFIEIPADVAQLVVFHHSHRAGLEVMRADARGVAFNDLLVLVCGRLPQPGELLEVV